MAKGLPRSRSRGAPIKQPIIKQTFVVRNGLLTVAGASGVGFGSLVIGDFPEANILFLGAVGYMQFTGPTSGSLVDTWQGDFSIGTTPASDGTLSAGDIDLLNTTALAAATAEASPRTRAISVNGDTGEIHDNTDNSLEMNLNLLVDNGDISADGIVFTVNGEFVISYVPLLDD